MINEFSGRNFSCSNLVPSYGDLAAKTQICSTVGSVAGLSVVSGDAYLLETYAYEDSNRWRNLLIMIIFVVGLCITYLAASEWIGAKPSRGEILLFRKATSKQSFEGKKDPASDIEADISTSALRLKHKFGDTEVQSTATVVKQTSVFQWSDICYDIKVKGKSRRLLDHVDGWVKPGTLTALMGVSGAGKTTLLDVLASRMHVGVISGSKTVNGLSCESSFQRRTGYVQQQDLHLSTSTVREALNFSALLRQPDTISNEDKLHYVNEVIKMLDMQEFADAVVGIPGEGLNIEQRKRLTIGIELAAKPDLLLFLDEPTSGLDSQTSWSICDLLVKLTKAGQAILCTIHQPSAILFQRFDRLLFLAEGGKPVYFGEIGRDSLTVISYFEANGSGMCPADCNPAEWILQVVVPPKGQESKQDWPAIWRTSMEFQAMKDELTNQRISMKACGCVPCPHQHITPEFAASWVQQFKVVLNRLFGHYWRTPSYIFSKLSLCLLSALFIGFSFYHSTNTQQGLQNQLLAVFLLLTILGQISDQMMPLFAAQRELYQARERPSKVYSWTVFLASNILVEMLWNGFMSILMFFCIYFPIGLYRNANSSDVVQRGGLFFLFIFQLLLFTSTFTNMVIAGFQTIENAANIVSVSLIMCLVFCGILAPPETLPRFWIFMYRVSPLTYLVDGLLSTALANADAICADYEFLKFNAPIKQTCGEYMRPWIEQHGGYLMDTATSLCSFCQISSTNTFLAAHSSDYEHRWRNSGILWAFITFNIMATFLVYWLVSVPKARRHTI